MQFKMISPTLIKCNNCGNRILIKPDDFDYDIEFLCEHGGDNGSEFEHIFTANIECPHCGNLISLVSKSYEFPEGAYEYGPEYDFEGCSILEQPEIVVDYSDDLYFDTPDQSEINTLYQAQDELYRFIEKPELLRQISPRQFEKTICTILNRYGFDAKLTPATRDGGKDIIAKKIDSGLPIVVYVECKQFKPGRKVGIEIVQRLSSVQNDDHANVSVLVTTSSFTSGAKKYANEHNMTLFDWDKLKNWLIDAARKQAYD